MSETINSISYPVENHKFISTLQKNAIPTKVDYTQKPDEFVSSKKNTKKIILGAVGGTLAVGFVIAHAIKKREVKDIKNLRNAFREAFLNDSITEQEAIQIKNRYKELAKIKDREDYARALFEETKKNFGLADSNLYLEFGDIKGAKGGFNRAFHKIIITPKAKKFALLKTMCHEFRHVKQMQLASSLDPDFAISSIHSDVIKTRVDKITEEYISKGGTDNSPQHVAKIVKQAEKEIIKERYGDLTPVPEKLKEFARNSLESLKHAKNHNKDILGYWKSFHEVDARKASGSIEKYVKERCFNLDWMSNIEMRIRSLFQKKSS